ncbi:MAG TPA: metallopeptidase TldD-related protein [Candidatus Acidoferrales bacterium]|nr:metallopeptidase TldD-related protein [Candidatus Acidoferrales bacterium]
MNGNHLLELARNVVKQAQAAGATDAECTIAEGEEFSASVRMREVENLKEAGSRGAGLRILIGRKTGASSTSDLSSEGVAHLVKSAIELADITSEDPQAGLPDDDEFGAIAGDLGLYSEDVPGLDPGLKIDTAKRAEEAALSADPRIFNSEGASFDNYVGRHLFANSRGFAGEYRSSYCSLSTSPVARDGESMERDYWFTLARGFAGLEAPEDVGRMAAKRALRRLNAVKVPTQKVPVVFEPRTARSLLDNVFEAVHGMSIYRHESFLAGKLGEKIAAACVTLVDDGTLPGLFGTSPFDDEGVPSRRTVVIDHGVLKSYLMNTYAARKLGMKTTGNASRGLTGNAGIGHGNFFVEKGVQTPEEMIAGIPNGFYVTELMGFGVNIVTGDYSRGAAGLWIRDGELAFAVSEVTIAGNLSEMLLGLEAIGSDLEFRGSVAAPTLKIGEMTVGGK